MPKFDFSGATVLTVDRDEFCLKILASMLRGFGFQTVFRAADVDEAERVLAARDIDFLVMDQAPFGQKGFDLIGRIRGEQGRKLSDSTIFFSTGHATQNMLFKMKSAGADYVICKPFSTKSLLHRMIWVAQKVGAQNATSEFISLTE